MHWKCICRIKKEADLTEFFNTTQQYLGALRERPEIAAAYSTFSINYPQWEVTVDAAKCKRAGITPGCRTEYLVWLLRRTICIQLQPLLESV